MNRIYLIFFLFLFSISFCQAQCPADTSCPFTVDSVHLKIWNGTEYVPFFVKGCNLGVTLPGKYPGQLEVSRSQYADWIRLIKDAGFNCVRLYTLHFPVFYEVLDSFNLAHPGDPLFFFQGVWLEEDVPGYNSDLNMLDPAFSVEIMQDVDCIHGSLQIAPRLGKAYGDFHTDVSKWNIGYIIAREIAPEEAITTNQLHASDSVFTGNYFSLSGNPSEIFLTRHLDLLVDYENSNYHTQRPVSACNWPTLDPLSHPFEFNRWEDTVSIDLNNIDFHRAPAGFFVSFHAYPYYPDFISRDSAYQNFSDAYGQDSYIGYLTALKNHYNRVPLVIAESGVPSSWGIAHYSQSGMNHGGNDEYQQGQTMLRIMNNVRDVGAAGAINFAFIDEWFKRTWITDPIDYNIDRRILWHNIMGAEQNFGIIGFRDSVQMQLWDSFPSTNPLKEISAAADYDFFHIGLNLSDTFDINDDMWISFDTYRADLGESILPNNDTVQNRAEFALHISNYSAELYVTQAYDIFRIWSGNADPMQLFHSVKSDGAPWTIEHWENNDTLHQIQYVGNLNVNHNYLPPSSKDAVTICGDSIHIRLPWSLLNFTDPSRMTALNDDRSVPGTQDTMSDGIAISVRYKNQLAIPQSRFTWPIWDTIVSVNQYVKGSYPVIQNGLTYMNNPAIAMGDKYSKVDSFPFIANKSNGVINNDFDFDGTIMQALLIGNAQHGFVSLSSDGSFAYTADSGYTGTDYFEYCIFDGHDLSATATVCLQVNNTSTNVPKENGQIITLYPNPAKDFLNIKSSEIIVSSSVYNNEGRLLKDFHDGENNSIDIKEFSSGNYFLKLNLTNSSIVEKFTVIH